MNGGGAYRRRGAIVEATTVALLHRGPSRKRARMSGRRGTLLVLALGLVGACGGDAPPPARTPTPLDRTTTGTIAGEVRLDGPVPPMADVRFGGFAECASQHPGPEPAGDLLVRDGTLQNAFVYVKDGLGDRVFAMPTEPVVVDQ